MADDYCDYWVISIGRDTDRDTYETNIYVDGLAKVTELVPTRKENFLEIIATGKADFSEVNEIIRMMDMRVRFNPGTLEGPYVFRTDQDLFDDENEFREWFDSCPKEAARLVKRKSG